MVGWGVTGTFCVFALFLKISTSCSNVVRSLFGTGLSGLAGD